MNNKSDKKHKRKQKQKQTKHKKKTTSRQSKKKNEIKSGGMWPFSNGSYNPTTKKPPNKNKWKNTTTLAELQEPLLSNSNRLANAQRANLNTHPRNVSQPPAPVNSRTLPQNASQSPTNRNNYLQTVSQPPPPPPPPPNVQPQGFNTLKAQSRCSIM